jgi:hypothetical protein
MRRAFPAAEELTIASLRSERVVYLIIIVLVAAVGIGRLWWIQRRLATSLQTVDGFRASLERLSGQEAAPPAGAGSREAAPLSTPPDKTSSDPYLEPLDPERRAAAKRRLEARRRGALRSSDLRSR